MERCTFVLIWVRYFIVMLRAAGWSCLLIGFDDIDVAAQVLPALSTMHIDTVGMGRLAVQLLRNRVEFPAAGLVTTVLRPALIERQSVRTLSDS
jgi:DNA-binding LacI/PurR family transcriptional regulator